VRIFIDDCIWQVTRDFVQQLGHDMATIEERGLAGADDEIVLAQAVSENRAL
jgi:predicted nuclease of predicted toxin-antitoxin system